MQTIFKDYVESERHTELQITVTPEGRLYNVSIWNTLSNYHHEIQKPRREDYSRETLEETDMTFVFKRLAQKNPHDFKELYYILKENDKSVFPLIQRALEEVRVDSDFE